MMKCLLTLLVCQILSLSAHNVYADEAQAPNNICGVNVNSTASLKAAVANILRQRIKKYSKSQFQFSIDNDGVEISGMVNSVGDAVLKSVFVIARDKVWWNHFTAWIETPDGMLPYLKVKGAIQWDNREPSRPELSLDIKEINGSEVSSPCDSSQIGCAIDKQVFGNDLLHPKCPISSDAEMSFDF